MKTRTTLLLLALTIGLGAWMLLRDNAPPDLGGHLLFDWSANVTEKAEVKVDVDPAEVGGIDLKSSTVQISLRKGPDGKRAIGGAAPERPGDLAFLVDLAARGEFLPVIDRIYPLDRIVDAHAHVDTGHKRGSVVMSLVD